MSKKNILLMLNARKFLDVIARYAAAHDWRITLMMDGSVPHGWSGDGALVSYMRGRGQTDFLRKLAKSSIPMVGLSRVFTDIGMHRVNADFVGLGRLQARHLYERGYKSFMFCSAERIPGAQIAYESFADELRRFGHRADVQWYVHSESVPEDRAQNWKAISSAVMKPVSGKDKPLGVACMSDGIAIYFLDVALENGLSVPTDVGIIGANDNAVLCENQQVTLSSVNPNHAQMALEACDMLDKLMNGGSVPDETVVVPALGVFERESTGVPAVGSPLVVKAVKVMNDHLSGSFSLGQLAAALEVSPSKLNRAFNDAGCSTPAAYLRELRIRKAKSLLRTTDFALNYIAEVTGFAHAAHFLNVFRAYVGETPSVWRERWR